MNTARFQEITGRYPSLRIAVVGDYFLDRYLHIDPSLNETSFWWSEWMTITSI